MPVSIQQTGSHNEELRSRGAELRRQLMGWQAQVGTENGRVLGSALAPLAAAIEDLRQGIPLALYDRRYPPAARTLEPARRRKVALTPRMTAIARLIAEGHSTKEIAALLGRSVKTVESHRMSLMSRIGVHDVAGVVRFAISSGLLSTLQDAERVKPPVTSKSVAG